MTIVVCPEDFPKAKHILEWEFSLERDEDPPITKQSEPDSLTEASSHSPEAEEQIEAVRFLCQRRQNVTAMQPNLNFT